MIYKLLLQNENCKKIMHFSANCLRLKSRIHKPFWMYGVIVDDVSSCSLDGILGYWYMYQSWKYSDENFSFAVTRVMTSLIWWDGNLDNNLSLCSGLVIQKQRSSRTRAKHFLELRQAIIVTIYSNWSKMKFGTYKN